MALLDDTGGETQKLSHPIINPFKKYETPGRRNWWNNLIQKTSFRSSFSRTLEDTRKLTLPSLWETINEQRKKNEAAFKLVEDTKKKIQDTKSLIRPMPDDFDQPSEEKDKNPFKPVVSPYRQPIPLIQGPTPLLPKQFDPFSALNPRISKIFELPETFRNEAWAQAINNTALPKPTKKYLVGFMSGEQTGESLSEDVKNVLNRLKAGDNTALDVISRNQYIKDELLKVGAPINIEDFFTETKNKLLDEVTLAGGYRYQAELLIDQQIAKSIKEQEEALIAEGVDPEKARNQLIYGMSYQATLEDVLNEEKVKHPWLADLELFVPKYINTEYGDPYNVEMIINPQLPPYMVEKVQARLLDEFGEKWIKDTFSEKQPSQLERVGKAVSSKLPGGNIAYKLANGENITLTDILKSNPITGMPVGVYEKTRDAYKNVGDFVRNPLSALGEYATTTSIIPETPGRDIFEATDIGADIERRTTLPGMLGSIAPIFDTPIIPVLDPETNKPRLVSYNQYHEKELRLMKPVQEKVLKPVYQPFVEPLAEVSEHTIDALFNAAGVNTDLAHSIRNGLIDDVVNEIITPSNVAIGLATGGAGIVLIKQGALTGSKRTIARGVNQLMWDMFGTGLEPALWGKAWRGLDEVVKTGIEALARVETNVRKNPAFLRAVGNIQEIKSTSVGQEYLRLNNEISDKSKAAKFLLYNAERSVIQGRVPKHLENAAKLVEEDIKKASQLTDNQKEARVVLNTEIRKAYTENRVFKLEDLNLNKYDFSVDDLNKAYNDLYTTFGKDFADNFRLGKLGAEDLARISEFERNSIRPRRTVIRELRKEYETYIDNELMKLSSARNIDDVIRARVGTDLDEDLGEDVTQISDMREFEARLAGEGESVTDNIEGIFGFDPTYDGEKYLKDYSLNDLYNELENATIGISKIRTPRYLESVPNQEQIDELRGYRARANAIINEIEARGEPLIPISNKTREDEFDLGLRTVEEREPAPPGMQYLGTPKEQAEKARERLNYYDEEVTTLSEKDIIKRLNQIDFDIEDHIRVISAREERLPNLSDEIIDIPKARVAAGLAKKELPTPNIRYPAQTSPRLLMEDTIRENKFDLIKLEEIKNVYVKELNSRWKVQNINLLGESFTDIADMQGFESLMRNFATPKKRGPIDPEQWVDGATTQNQAFVDMARQGEYVAIAMDRNGVMAIGDGRTHWGGVDKIVAKLGGYKDSQWGIYNEGKIFRLMPNFNPHMPETLFVQLRIADPSTLKVEDLVNLKKAADELNQSRIQLILSEPLKKRGNNLRSGVIYQITTEDITSLAARKNILRSYDKIPEIKTVPNAIIHISDTTTNSGMSGFEAKLLDMGDSAQNSVITGRNIYIDRLIAEEENAQNILRQVFKVDDIPSRFAKELTVDDVKYTYDPIGNRVFKDGKLIGNDNAERFIVLESPAARRITAEAIKTFDDLESPLAVTTEEQFDELSFGKRSEIYTSTEQRAIEAYKSSIYESINRSIRTNKFTDEDILSRINELKNKDIQEKGWVLDTVSLEKDPSLLYEVKNDGKVVYQIRESFDGESVSIFKINSDETIGPPFSVESPHDTAVNIQSFLDQVGIVTGPIKVEPPLSSIDDLTHTANLDIALEKQSLNTPIVVYRGIDAELFSKTKVGDIVYDPAFTSTTLKRDIASKWGLGNQSQNRAILEIEVPQGTSVVPTTDIGFYGDAEFILPRNTSLEITSIEPIIVEDSIKGHKTVLHIKAEVYPTPKTGRQLDPDLMDLSDKEYQYALRTTKEEETISQKYLDLISSMSEQGDKNWKATFDLFEEDGYNTSKARKLVHEITTTIDEDEQIELLKELSQSDEIDRLREITGAYLRSKYPDKKTITLYKIPGSVNDQVIYIQKPDLELIQDSRMFEVDIDDIVAAPGMGHNLDESIGEYIVIVRNESITTIKDAARYAKYYTLPGFSTVVRGVAGFSLGYSSGDTPEERLRNALLGGAIGVFGPMTLRGGRLAAELATGRASFATQLDIFALETKLDAVLSNELVFSKMKKIKWQGEDIRVNFYRAGNRLNMSNASAFVDQRTNILSINLDRYADISDDYLGLLLGHELGHVYDRFIMRQFISNKLIEPGTSLNETTKNLVRYLIQDRNVTLLPTQVSDGPHQYDIFGDLIKEDIKEGREINIPMAQEYLGDFLGAIMSGDTEGIPDDLVKLVAESLNKTPGKGFTRGRYVGRGGVILQEDFDRFYRKIPEQWRYREEQKIRKTFQLRLGQNEPMQGFKARLAGEEPSEVSNFVENDNIVIKTPTEKELTSEAEELIKIHTKFDGSRTPSFITPTMEKIADDMGIELPDPKSQTRVQDFIDSLIEIKRNLSRGTSSGVISKIDGDKIAVKLDNGETLITDSTKIRKMPPRLLANKIESKVEELGTVPEFTGKESVMLSNGNYADIEDISDLKQIIDLPNPTDQDVVKLINSSGLIHIERLNEGVSVKLTSIPTPYQRSAIARLASTEKIRIYAIDPTTQKIIGSEKDMEFLGDPLERINEVSSKLRDISTNPFKQWGGTRKETVKILNSEGTINRDLRIGELFNKARLSKNETEVKVLNDQIAFIEEEQRLVEQYILQMSRNGSLNTPKLRGEARRSLLEQLRATRDKNKIKELRREISALNEASEISKKTIGKTEEEIRQEIAYRKGVKEFSTVGGTVYTPAKSGEIDKIGEALERLAGIPYKPVSLSFKFEFASLEYADNAIANAKQVLLWQRERRNYIKNLVKRGESSAADLEEAEKDVVKAKEALQNAVRGKTEAEVMLLRHNFINNIKNNIPAGADPKRTQQVINTLSRAYNNVLSLLTVDKNVTEGTLSEISKVNKAITENITGNLYGPVSQINEMTRLLYDSLRSYTHSIVDPLSKRIEKEIKAGFKSGKLKLNEKGRKAIEKLTPEQLVIFFEHEAKTVVQHPEYYDGVTNELSKVLEELQTYQLEHLNIARGLGYPIEAIEGPYIEQLWDVPRHFLTPTGAPRIPGRVSVAHDRLFADYIEGIRENWIPKDYSVDEVIRHSSALVDKTIADSFERSVVLEKLGARKLLPGERGIVPRGFREFESPLYRGWVAPELYVSQLDALHVVTRQGKIITPATHFVSRFKNTMFGPMDFGVMGVQVLKALAFGGPQLVLGMVNSGLTALHSPWFVKLYLEDEDVLAHVTQAALDGVHQGLGPTSITVGEGTLLHYIPIAGKYLDAPISWWVDKFAKVQFGWTLTPIRNMLYQGNLVALRLTGSNINDPKVRRMAADNANALTGASRGATIQGRRKAESTLLISSQMFRAEAATLAQVAKIAFPPIVTKVSKEERILALTTLASYGIMVHVLGGAIANWTGNEPPPWDPRKGNWATITFKQLKDNKGNPLSVPLIPSRGLIRAIGKSVVALGGTDEMFNAIFEGDIDTVLSEIRKMNPEELAQIWLQYVGSKGNPAIMAIPNLTAGVGYYDGRFRMGGIPLEGRIRNSLPSPIILKNLEIPFGGFGDKVDRYLSEEDFSLISPAAAFSALGFNLFPLSASKQRDESVANWAIENNIRNMNGDLVTTWKELDRFQQEDYSSTSEGQIANKKVNDARDKENDTWNQFNNAWEDKKIIKTAMLATAALDIQPNVPGGAQLYNNSVRDINASFSRTYEDLAEGFGVDLNQRDPRSKDEALYYEYIALDPGSDEFIKPASFTKSGDIIPASIDWDKFHEKQNILLSQMSENARSSIKANKFNLLDDRANEAAKRKDTASRQLEAMLNVPKYRGLTVKESESVDSLIESVDRVRDIAKLVGLSLSRKDILLNMYKSGMGDTKIVATATLLSFDAFKELMYNNYDQTIFLANPDIALYWDFTYNMMPAEIQQEWFARYGMRTKKDFFRGLDLTYPVIPKG